MNKEFTFKSKKTSIDLLYDDVDIAIATMDLMHQDDTEDDHNLNMCNISHECIEKSLETFRNKPIIFRLTKDRKDVTEHANSKKELQETQIGGIIPQDTNFNFIERDNGKTYVNCDVILYKKYCPELIQILKENDGNLEVSTELKAYGEQDEDNGIFYIENFILQGVCILSKKYPAGIEGSNIQVLKFSQMDTNNMNERYLQFSKNRNVDSDINVEINENGEKEVKEIVNNLSVEALRDLLWNSLKDYTYEATYGTTRRYWICDIYFEEKYIIVNDEKENHLFKMEYTINEDNVAVVDVDNKVKVVRETSYREVKNSFVLSKENFGKNGVVVVNKSKESVIEKDFDNFDHILICNKILSANNYNELVKEAFLVVENNWEENPIENLKYPIMDFTNGSLVYNSKAFEFSLAKANDDDNVEIIEKINSLKEELFNNSKENENMENGNVVEQEIVNTNDNWEEKYNALNQEYETIKNSLSEKEQECSKKDEQISDLQNSLKETKEKLEKFENEEKFSKMKKYLEKFEGNMDKEEYLIIAKKLENVEECYKMNFSEFKQTVDEVVLEFVSKNKNTNQEETIVETNINNTIQKDYQLDNDKKPNKVRTIDDVLQSLGVN